MLPAGALPLNGDPVPTYTTIHTVQLAALLAACRVSAVAVVAGVGAAAWASSTSPRVMQGDKAGYVRGLHRGRLPALEVFSAVQDWEHQAANGGTVRATWTLRAHHNGPTWDLAEAGCRAILAAALASCRATTSPVADYLAEGSEAFRTLVASPLGFALECDILLYHTYDRATYGVATVP